MAATHAAAKAITVPCETPTCTAYLTLPPDSPLPRDPWFCTQCLDHIAAQEADAMARHYGQEEQTDADVCLRR